MTEKVSRGVFLLPREKSVAKFYHASRATSDLEEGYRI